MRAVVFLNEAKAKAINWIMIYDYDLDALLWMLA